MALPQPTPDNLAAVLAEIPQITPTVRVTWWPWPKGWTGAFIDSGRQAARITRSVGASAAWTIDLADGPERLRNQAELAAEVGATLALNYSPWHDRNNPDARGWDAAAITEVERCQRAFAAVCETLGGLAVAPEVERVWLDQEVLRADLDANGEPKPPLQYPDQADALRLKNDLIFDLAKSFFPRARVGYHGQLSRHHTIGERTDGLAGTECYYGRDYAAQCWVFERLLAAIDAAPAPRVGRWEPVPWIGIGGYYDNGPNGARGFVNKPAAVAQTWTLGRRLLHQWTRENPGVSGTAWGRAFDVVIWPTRNDLSYWTHLVALFAGAANIKDSDGDWLNTLVI